ncbi:MAG: sortase [Bacilli bacterium]|nr:sortase [Bacilli bacterium]
MRTQNQLKVNNKIKKSHVLVIGSLLVFIGIISLSWNYILKMRDEVFSDMRIAMMDDIFVENHEEDEIEGVPVVENVEVNSNSSENKEYVVDYSKYLGVLEIPKIRLKRGFYNIDSKYNNIKYNVTMVEGSTLPDVEFGNLILMAHSGDAYISYFAYLYKLEVGDMAYVTYAGRKYEYQIVNIYEVEKNGAVVIKRNYDKSSLTMITCTKDNDTTQTVYISELVG